jgi:hypothetical protein
MGGSWLEPPFRKVRAEASLNPPTIGQTLKIEPNRLPQVGFPRAGEWAKAMRSRHIVRQRLWRKMNAFRAAAARQSGSRPLIFAQG